MPLTKNIRSLTMRSRRLLNLAKAIGAGTGQANETTSTRLSCSDTHGSMN